MPFLRRRLEVSTFAFAFGGIIVVGVVVVTREWFYKGEDVLLQRYVTISGMSYYKGTSSRVHLASSVGGTGR